MTDETCTIDDIGGFLGDPTARQILVATSQRPMSAESLSEAAGASKPTIYRRLEDLRRCDLLVEQTKLDPDAGHHHTVFATDLERIIVEIQAAGIEYDLHRRESMEDRFTRLIEEL